MLEGEFVHFVGPLCFYFCHQSALLMDKEGTFQVFGLVAGAVFALAGLGWMLGKSGGAPVGHSPGREHRLSTSEREAFASILDSAYTNDEKEAVLLMYAFYRLRHDPRLILTRAFQRTSNPEDQAAYSFSLSNFYLSISKLDDALKWALKHEEIRTLQLQAAVKSVKKVAPVFELNHAEASLHSALIHGKLGNFLKANVCHAFF